MTSFRMGSHGAGVEKVQGALQQRGLYRGPIDGEFGGATFSAVMSFQRSQRLEPDGVVGGATWTALFGRQEAPPEPIVTDLARRCLALTGAFETGTGFPECFCGISGDFDGQGVSFGVLQWNFGQRSLQPLLKDMIDQHPGVAQDVFGTYIEPLRQALAGDQDELMAFARSVQHPVKHTVFEPWRGFAKALGRTSEFQDIQARHARDKFELAIRMCTPYGLKSERAVALLFDIVVQNGSISPVVQAQIVNDLRRLPSSLSSDEREVRAMESVANRRAEAANPRWIDDVRSRKLCIARGEGTVHGIDYDLEGQFGIGLRPFQA